MILTIRRDSASDFTVEGAIGFFIALSLFSENKVGGCNSSVGKSVEYSGGIPLSVCFTLFSGE